MFFHVDPASATPLYSQIAEQLRLAVGSGRLKAGDRLPSVRELAEQVQINPMTVARVYSDLEREGLLETQRGRGTFVADRPSALPAARKADILKQHIQRLLADAHQLRIEPEALLKLIHREIADFERKTGGR